MSERGVFAVDRGIFDHPRLRGEKFTKVQAFLWLVAEAAWKPHPRIISGMTINLRRGQTACSLRFMAKAWGWEEPRVRRFLAGLKTDATIDVATDAGVTVVTICKYDTYQRVSLPTDAHSDASADAATTQERRKLEDREYREEDTSLRSVAAKPKKHRTKPKTPIYEDTQPTERQLQDAYDEGLTLPQIRIEWRGFRDNHLKHGSLFSDWPAAWRTWLRHPIRTRNTARASPARRGSTADLWAADAIEGNAEIQGSHHDQRAYDDQAGNWDRATRPADGRPYRDASQSAKNDPRQFPTLRLVGGV